MQVIFLGLWFHGLAFSTGNRFTLKSLQRRFLSHSCEVRKGTQPIFGEVKKSCGKNSGLSYFKLKQHPLPQFADRHMHLFVSLPTQTHASANTHKSNQQIHMNRCTQMCTHSYKHTCMFTHAQPLQTRRLSSFLFSVLQRTDCCLVLSRVSHHSSTFACTQTHTVLTHRFWLYNTGVAT